MSRGAEIRQLREGSRLRLSDVAAEAGISVSQLSLLETGQRTLTLEMYAELVGAVGKAAQAREEEAARLQAEMGFGARTAAGTATATTETQRTQRTAEAMG